MSKPKAAAESDAQPMHPYHRAGQLLLAALITYQGGFSSADYALKRYVPEEVNPAWCDVAQFLLHCMQERTDPRALLLTVPQGSSQQPM